MYTHISFACEIFKVHVSMWPRIDKLYTVPLILMWMSKNEPGCPTVAAFFDIHIWITDLSFFVQTKY